MTNGLLEFGTSYGTTELTNHSNLHRKNPIAGRFQKVVTIKVSQKNIRTESAAVATTTGNFSISFTEKKIGMALIAQALL